MKCVVFAVGGSFVVEVVAVLARLGWTVAAFVSNEDGMLNPNQMSPIVAAGDVTDDLAALPCVLGVAGPVHRKMAHHDAVATGFATFPAVVDPTAIVAHDATIGEGALINAGVVIGARANLEPFSLVNRSASVGHSTGVGPCAFIGPGAIICGDSSVEGGAFVGAGAILTPGSAVGTDAFVGAGTVVRGQVAANTSAIGTRTMLVGDQAT